MKTKALFAILALINLLIVQGSELNSTNEDPDTNSTRRILYGTLASVSDFPYLVKLDIGGSLGAGAIIAENWILTAGHCVYEQACSSVIEIFPAVWEPGQSVKPVECYPHPQYSKVSLAYDVGLIRVQENLIEDGRAKTVSLPAPGAVYSPGTNVVIAGWGLTETNGNPSGLLRGEFQIEEWNYCNEIHTARFCEANPDPNCFPRSMPMRILCTRGQGDPTPTTCFGDSGGPAVINGVVAGVVSFGVSKGDGCKMGEPTMLTNIADYLPWIYSIIAPEMDTSGFQVQPEPEY